MNSGIAKRRSFLASRKNSGKRVTIGFTGIADFRSYIGQEYIAGMMKAAADYDVNFINFAGAIKYSLFDDINFISHYLKSFKFMHAPLVDGLVTWASSLREFLEPDEIIENFNSLKPLPMVDIGYLEISGIPQIRIDNKYSIHILMEHLIEKHHYSRFAFVGSNISSPHQDRLNCYRNELKHHNISEIPDSVFMTKTMESSQLATAVDEFVHKFVHNGHCDIECIVTTSDIIAAAVIEELDKHGLSVPKDIAVTGFNNQYSGISARSPVTTLDLEYFKRGYSAVELLIDRIMNPGLPAETVLVPTSIMVRQSCGCFEQSVVDAGSCDLNNSLLAEHNDSSEEALRGVISEKIREIFPQLVESDVNSLLDAIFSDIYEDLNPSYMLRWFQTFLQDIRKESAIVSRDLQQCITRLRNLILPMVRDNDSQFAHIENIFHQLRTLISVYNEYDKVSPHENLYTMNNLSQAAINFATATSGRQIKEVLCHQLSEMGITGIILALSENMTSDLGSANIELVQPELPFLWRDKLPYKVSDPVLIPKQFFPQTRRFSVILETLHHEDKYFGYAFLEIGNPNISIYDTVRLLLSNALNQVYQKEGRTKDKSLLLKNEQLIGILNIPKQENNEERKIGLTSSQITNYLLEHINEMTNLDQMSEDLSVSKSHLVRRAKELTGYTIQTLHEKLKIEQAKNMLQIESMKLTEISARLGFQNQNYFSSVFKKNTGMSPRNWAKRNGH
ncbi:MAG: substrate-binding domain-containing protein [Treponema sp.]|nr:substrate-binding domain-containing protein [Candidatus Treponema equifaecale]